MSLFPYQFFDEYVVRTHLFSQKSFQEELSKGEISDSELKKVCNDPVFQEAIYLASPNLYDEINKWLSSEKQLSSKEYQKLKQTILKYYSRMSTRSTPFGLFAGVGLGKFGPEAPNIFSNDQHSTDNLLRDTRLDMYFLVSLAQHFAQPPEIRNRLLFFPNNSIYKVGKRIRYIEYQYAGGKRDYIISFAPLSNELQQILDFSKQGKTIQQIAEILISSEITKEEAGEFIEELINNQVLVSELEPNVSGNDFLDTIITVLNKIRAKKEAETLFSIKTKLNELDQKIGNPASKYAEIEDLIKSFDTEYEQKYLFQTDLYFKDVFALSPHWKKKLKQGIGFLNKITLPQRENEFSRFKKAFYERFEMQEVPLLYVLDAEIGIGYKQNVSSKGIHPYIEDLVFPISQKNQNKNIELTSVHQILNEKLQEALLDNQYSIELTDEDFKGFEESRDDLPDTISIMTELISENNQEKLFLNTSTGSSAANLLGRFCSEESKIQDLTKTIAQKEEMLRQAQHDKSEILAEIIHLPEARIGNVIRRPTLRWYEIPYLAQSLLPVENQIPVEDLYISLKNDQIVLRSKKLNREIKPYLTNAHNYYTNTLPVYHFLSDLYSQDTRSGLHFSWGGLESIYTFLPRVEYKNIILSKASWKITAKEIKKFLLSISDKDQLFSELENWRKIKQIPQWIQWMKSDNKLTINLENYDLVKMFIDSVKNEDSIIIEEFLYNENDDFKHEFIFPMYREESRAKNQDK
ncbi:lantibiotic dehydratase family protein [Chryseobacterium rhizosphaerae]|uniref:lantibiotic dehydratase family protein n=1 Tax=Chryseobacterium rhizosphaerae TaxID=395937 RepID=UPI002358BC6A|nr:lantibiotic dehydratase family protein [Chryseobacterium rhizosphaerae]MDC8098434.1 lantibiotic dehydratase family protein [Chryseobacterium rhizosphaerae]